MTRQIEQWSSAMRTSMSRGLLLTKLVMLAAAASLLIDQLRSLRTLSSSSRLMGTFDGWDRPHGPTPSTARTAKSDDMNGEIAQDGEDDDDVVVASTISDGNATTIDIHEEDEEDEEEKNKKTEKWKPLPWSLPNLIRKSTIQQSSLDFMNELGSMKRGMNISLPWEGDDDAPAIRISPSLPTPIISLNLPKSATYSLYEYFHCGGLTSAHAFSAGSIRIGECMRDNFLSDAPPFRGCDLNGMDQRIQFYSDIGIQGPKCYYPSLHDGGLEHIAKFYPNATILLLHRKFDDWHASIRKWGGGRLLKIWKNTCGFAGDDGQCLPSDIACWRSFYDAHTEKIRRFAIDHPSLTYLELQLDERTPMALEMYTGISSECFKDCHPGKPTDPTIDMKTYNRCKPINATT
ncbi:hypothetical protein ACHAXA_002710 [Cyclostephanos tholiformis]|uniref:Sulfotransferase domain-containing protein n=1 Tax=Cyclostephanos tholiformis TaxID=382380 RepID=A0ABD3R6X9_9STRA